MDDSTGYCETATNPYLPVSWHCFLSLFSVPLKTIEKLYSGFLMFSRSKDRRSRLEVFYKKGVLRNFAKFTRKHLRQSLFLIKLQAEACNFIKKETLTQVFSCKFCKISKTTFSYRTALVAASVKKKISGLKWFNVW